MFPGLNRRKKGSISRGDFDRDGVSNRKDCEPLNFREQGPEHEKKYGYCKKCGYGYGSQGHQDYCITKEKGATPRREIDDYPEGAEFY